MRWLVLLAVIVQTGCGGSSAPPAPTAAPPPTVTPADGGKKDSGVTFN